MNEREQNNAAPDAPQRDDGFTDMSKLISEAVERIRNKKGNPDAITGISTCFPGLNYYTSGLQRGDLIVVAGRPSMGAHSFVLNIVVHVALVNELPVAILDNEMGGVTLATRMIASIAKIDCHDLLKGQIECDESGRLGTAIDALTQAPIYFSSLTPLSVQELGEHLRGLNQRTGGLGLVVVDCLPELILTGEKMHDDCAIKIAHTSRYLKALAMELNVPIVVLSPIERDLEERCNKRPSLTDLPGMGAIANAADLVLLLYRDEIYNPESEEKGETTIIVSRNRGGPFGSFSLRYDVRYGSFAEMFYG